MMETSVTFVGSFQIFMGASKWIQTIALVIILSYISYDFIRIKQDFLCWSESEQSTDQKVNILSVNGVPRVICFKSVMQLTRSIPDLFYLAWAFWIIKTREKNTIRIFFFLLSKNYKKKKIMFIVFFLRYFMDQGAAIAVAIKVSDDTSL